MTIYIADFLCPSKTEYSINYMLLFLFLYSYNEALCDFESAVKLSRTIPSPHVCAGLIYMLHKNNICRALRCFCTAIFVDPTCIRGYLCRANAFQRDEKVNCVKIIYKCIQSIQFKLAILDYARVIHLEPKNPAYYLLKVVEVLFRYAILIFALSG